MKNKILIYGLIAGALMTCLMIGPLFLTDMRDPSGYDRGEIIGYLAMVLSLCVIFLGINSYKKTKQGELTFGQGFLLGTSIALVAGVLFGFFSYLTYAFIFPDFLAAYMEHYIQKIREGGAPGPEIEKQIAEINSQKDFFLSPVMGGVLMFMTVVPIGTLISLIASLVLRSRPRPA